MLDTLCVLNKLISDVLVNIMKSHKLVIVGLMALLRKVSSNRFLAPKLHWLCLQPRVAQLF